MLFHRLQRSLEFGLDKKWYLMVDLEQREKLRRHNKTRVTFNDKVLGRQHSTMVSILDSGASCSSVYFSVEKIQLRLINGTGQGKVASGL